MLLGLLRPGSSALLSPCANRSAARTALGPSSRKCPLLKHKRERGTGCWEGRRRYGDGALLKAGERWHEQGPPQLKRGRSAQVSNRGA
jgi:hypothetical protein